MAGIKVLGSITDNHKINQQFCKWPSNRFQGKSSFRIFKKLVSLIWQCSYPQMYPQQLDHREVPKTFNIYWSRICWWLFTGKRSVHGWEGQYPENHNIDEVFHIYSSNLQIQNVQLVLKVFKSKVAAALKVQGAIETANFIQLICNWWQAVNVSNKG